MLKSTALAVALLCAPLAAQAETGMSMGMAAVLGFKQRGVARVRVQ